MLADYAQYNFHLAMQKLMHFCTEQMGGFYLDILKDRLYTTPVASPLRRSAQTVLYHIVQTLVRLLAPVLSFTAHEVWQTLGLPDTVFIAEWYALPRQPLNKAQIANWESIVHLRSWAMREMEKQRELGLIGSSLQANLTFYLHEESAHILQELGDELRHIMITSSASVVVIPSTIEQHIKVLASPHAKCVRCWHYEQSVGENHSYVDLCDRCVENIKYYEYV